MKNNHPVVFSLTALILCMVCPTGFTQTQKPAAAAPRFRPDTILVKPGRGIATALLARQHAAHRARVEQEFPAIGHLQILKLPAGLSVEKAIEHYNRSGLVEYAEPDYEVSICVTPNDPSYLDGTLWGMNNTSQNGGTADADIDAPEAWDIRTNASPVIVAVIDTGVRYTHEDLAANMWINPCVSCPVNGIVYTNDVYGINAINNTGDPWDDHYHGTHVSGTIGGVGNNGKGVVGVAWNVRIMALKFLSSTGSGFTSDAIKCVNYAIAKGAKIMSNSWGGGGPDNALRDAIIAARNAGIIFVAAAGNNATDTDIAPFYPAGYDVDNILAVAATDRNDLLASFSNFGLNTVELGAPGVSTYSCYTNSANNAYGYLSGTSMATPHVSGALALLAAQFPSDTYSQLIYRVIGNVDPINSLASKCLTGGRLNVFKALTQTPKPIAVLAANPTGGEPPLTVAFTDTSLGTITNRSLNFGDGSAPTAVTTTTHTYNSLGTYNATLTVSGPTGSSTRTRQITVANNYTVSADAFAWIDTSAMTAVSLTDDSLTSALALPFTFSFYGQNYTSVFIGSNGLLLFGTSAGGTAFGNTDIASSATPNNAIYPYWDDLNPGTGGQIRYGMAPDGSFVASWEGVPHFNDVTATFTFQAILFPNGQIKLQYLEVRPANLTLGADRSATVGTENSDGTIARRYAYNGSTLLGNSQALRFTLSGSPPPSCTITCPSAIVVPNTTGQCGASVTYTAPTTGGSCGTVSCSPSSGSFFAVGSTTVTCSTSAGPSCSFTVTVTDTQNPTVSCPANLSTTTAAGQCAATVSYTTPTASDNCSGATVSCLPTSGSSFPKGTTTVTCTATDASGRTSNCSFTITVTDNQSPSITCPPNQSASAISPSGAAVTYPAPTVTDNCPGASASCNPVSGSTFPVGTTTVTCTATDASARTATCSFPVTVTSCSPTAPANLTAGASGRSSARVVKLNWTDTSACETRLEIQRAVGTGAFAPLTNVGTNVTSYSDASVIRGTTYRYQVRACNNSACSGFSNIAQVRVP